MHKLNERNEHEEMVKTVKENRNIVDKEIVSAFGSLPEHVKVDDIKIDYDNLKMNPMGGIEIGGYINGNPTYTFSLNMDKANDDSSNPNKLEIANSAVYYE